MILSFSFWSCIQSDQVYLFLFVEFEHIHGKIWILLFEFLNLIQSHRELYSGNLKVVQLFSIMRCSLRISDYWFTNV